MSPSTFPIDPPAGRVPGTARGGLSLRRLWPSDPLRSSEWTSLGRIARGEAPVDHPALAFWDCLRLAERAECPDELRQLARRRMKQLEPELHALFMRRSHG